MESDIFLQTSDIGSLESFESVRDERSFGMMRTLFQSHRGKNVRVRGENVRVRGKSVRVRGKNVRVRRKIVRVRGKIVTRRGMFQCVREKTSRAEKKTSRTGQKSSGVEERTSRTEHKPAGSKKNAEGLSCGLDDADNFLVASGKFVTGRGIFQCVRGKEDSGREETSRAAQNACGVEEKLHGEARVTSSGVPRRVEACVRV